MSWSKATIGGVILAALAGCATSNPEAGLSRVGASKEVPINAPLSAAILRRVKEVTPEEPAPLVQAQRAAVSTAEAPAVKAPAAAPSLPMQPAAQAAVAPAAAPAPAPAVEPQAAPASAPEAPRERWTVEVTDGTLSRALKRWAGRAGVPVVWDAPRDKPAFKADYLGSFEEAITQVMVDTQQTDYKLHACGYDNLIRVLHESQSCKR